MTSQSFIAKLAAALAGVALVFSAANATAETASAKMDAFQVAPTTLFANSKGTLALTLHANSVTYTLTYKQLVGAVSQAHIHLGAPGLAGAVIVFLCTNLGNGPAGTPACPASPGTVTRTLTAADVIGSASQHIPAGSMFALLRSIRLGITYAQVHTVTFPSGEARGQILVDEPADKSR